MPWVIPSHSQSWEPLLNCRSCMWEEIIRQALEKQNATQKFPQFILICIVFSRSLQKARIMSLLPFFFPSIWSNFLHMVDSITDLEGINKRANEWSPISLTQKIMEMNSGTFANTRQSWQRYWMHALSVRKRNGLFASCSKKRSGVAGCSNYT